MRQFGPEIATLLLWAIALFATMRALTVAGATLTLVAPVFAVCAAGSVVVLRAARRSASSRAP
jgi:hypothetical protein